MSTGLLVTVFLSLPYVAWCAEPEEQKLVIPIYNLAEITTQELAGGLREAQWIFRDAGIPVAWVLCESHLTGSDLCRGSRGPVTVSVGLIRTAPPGVKGSAVGFTIFGTSYGNRAAVIYDRIILLHQENPAIVDRAVLLGCAIAHESWHALSGSLSHGLVGLMKARWNDMDLVRMRQHRLLFHPTEAAMIRSGAQRLATSQKK